MARNLYHSTGLPGRGEFERLNACLFSLVLSQDVGLVQLQVQVPTLLGSLFAEDLHTRGHLA